MTLQSFIKKYDGATVDYDGSFPGQCVDLYRFYLRDVLDVPQTPQVSGARLIWNTYSKDYFERIPNTFFAIPKEGDIIIWDAFPGNPYGHVGMCVSGRFLSFTSFDSNWSTPRKARIEQHDYKNVIGWLRPKRKLLDLVNEALRECNDDPARSVGTLTLSKWWQNRVASDPKKFTDDIRGYKALVGAIRWHQLRRKYPHDL